MHILTGETAFLERAERWAGYSGSTVNKRRAFALKAIFKLLYY
jgi:hypothetical protein